jgi:Tfp pilus assembly protein PilF
VANEIDEAAGALLRGAETVGTGALDEALRRAAARLVHIRGDKPKDAISLLSGARDPCALSAKSEAAKAAGNHDALVQSVEAWAAASGATERALALVSLAEFRAEEGNLEAAEAALRDATLADGNLGTIRVVRELLARRAGDTAKLARAVSVGATDLPGEPLVAAAKLAHDLTALTQERELVGQAREDGEAPVTTDVLLLDTALAAGDDEGVRAGLRRQAERVPPEAKAGPLLALYDLAMEEGKHEDAVEILRDAAAVSPGNAMVLRPLGRLLGVDRPADRAELWLEEAASSSGNRAAFAATTAARWLESTGEGAKEAYQRALRFEPTYRENRLSQPQSSSIVQKRTTRPSQSCVSPAQRSWTIPSSEQTCSSGQPGHARSAMPKGLQPYSKERGPCARRTWPYSSCCNARARRPTRVEASSSFAPSSMHLPRCSGHACCEQAQLSKWRGIRNARPPSMNDPSRPTLRIRLHRGASIALRSQQGKHRWC